MWKNWHPSQSHSVRACRLAYDALMDNSFPSVWNFCPFYRGKARNANKKTPLKPGCVTQSRRCFSRNPFYDVLYTSYFVLCYWRVVIQVYICLIMRKRKRKKGRKKRKGKKILVFFTVYYLVIRISKFPMFWNSVMSRQKNFF